MGAPSKRPKEVSRPTTARTRSSTVTVPGWGSGATVGPGSDRGRPPAGLRRAGVPTMARCIARVVGNVWASRERC